MIRLLALFLSLLWAVGVAYAALQSWPTLPLDLPARDPQVQAALAQAVQNHVIRHSIAASLPLLMFVIALGWQSIRRR